MLERFLIGSDFEKEDSKKMLAGKRKREVIERSQPFLNSKEYILFNIKKWRPLVKEVHFTYVKSIVRHRSEWKD